MEKFLITVNFKNILKVLRQKNVKLFLWLIENYDIKIYLRSSSW